VLAEGLHNDEGALIYGDYISYSQDEGIYKATLAEVCR
jgi:hypothetical protein